MPQTHKRSVVRKATTSIRHALLKRKKKKMLETQINKLQKEIEETKGKQRHLRKGEAQWNGKGIFASMLAESLANKAIYREAEQMGLEIKLRRKQKQLKALKKKKRE